MVDPKKYIWVPTDLKRLTKSSLIVLIKKLIRVHLGAAVIMPVRDFKRLLKKANVNIKNDDWEYEHPTEFGDTMGKTPSLTKP